MRERIQAEKDFARAVIDALTNALNESNNYDRKISKPRHMTMWTESMRKV